MASDTAVAWALCCEQTDRRFEYTRDTITWVPTDYLLNNCIDVDQVTNEITINEERYVIVRAIRALSDPSLDGDSRCAQASTILAQHLERMNHSYRQDSYD